MSKPTLEEFLARAKELEQMRPQEMSAADCVEARRTTIALLRMVEELRSLAPIGVYDGLLESLVPSFDKLRIEKEGK